MNTDDCKQLLLKHHINPLSSIAYEVNAKEYTLTLEWIMEQFMAGSSESQKLFYESLSKVCDQDRKSVEKYFQDMGQLILMTSLSEVDHAVSL